MIILNIFPVIEGAIVLNEGQQSKNEMQLTEIAIKNANFHFRWDTFCYNLIHEARFIPNKQDEEFINEITDLLTKYFTVELPIGSAFYRARIISGHELSVQKHFEDRKTAHGKITVWVPSKSPIRGYSALSDVGIPPLEKASSNRASPKGIRYLYLADNVYTAVSEVRPSILEVVNVVEFTNKLPLKILKFPRTGQELKSMLQDDEEIYFYLYTIAKKMSFVFSRPIRRCDTDLEYLPTQYLVNAIKAKDSSIQGIAYPSFQSHIGMNFVTFSQDNLTLLDRPERIIRVQNVTYDCCNLNDLEEKINPQQTDYNSILEDKDVCEMKKQIIRVTDKNA